MQDLPLHRLPGRYVVELIDEVPRGHFGLVTDYSERVIGGTGTEARDVHSTIALKASRVRPRNASPPTCHALRHLHRQRLAGHIQSSAMNVPMRKVRKKTSS